MSPQDSTHRIHVGLVIKSMDVGGIERCIARLANGLCTQRFRVSVVCLYHRGIAADWITNPNVEIVELGRSTGNSLGIVRDLAREFKRLKLDIVHSHSWATMLESHLAARWAGRLLHVHAERGTVLGPASTSRWRQRARWWTMRWVLKRTAATMTNAHAVADKVRRTMNCPHFPITVIPNGLTVPYSAEELAASSRQLRQTLKVASEELIVGSVGRLVPVKNFALLLRAFAKLPGHLSVKSRLLLVGDGPCLPELQQLAASEGITNAVHFAGEQSDVWPYYACMDLFANSSCSEGMSQSILEAMACGKAILATDVGDSKRMITTYGKCGSVVSDQTVDSFSETMAGMLGDRSTLAGFGATSLAVHRQHYSLQAMIQAFEEFYEKVWRDAGRSSYRGIHA